MPSVVTQDDTPVAEYSWFADGSKYRVLTQQNNGYIYTGSLIYASNNGNLQIESTDFAGGRINLVENTSTNALSQDIHYFHTDHLGSVRAITNQGGSVVEQNAYYPFGSRHTFGNTYAQTTNRFKFNGKEEQTTGNLNYLDYGARMYDSNIGRWMVQDPLAEQMYGITPYRFSLNNPVVYIDPDGLREWRINQGGFVEQIIENDEKDIITILDDAGEVYNTLEFKSGTIQEKKFHQNGEEYTYYQIDETQAAQSLFEFVANYTAVEWSLAKLEHKGNGNTKNFIITANSHNKNEGMRAMLNTRIDGEYLWLNYNANEFSHNHPSGSTRPSGTSSMATSGDIPFAKTVSSLFNKQPIFKIFTRPNLYTIYYPVKQ